MNSLHEFILSQEGVIDLPAQLPLGIGDACDEIIILDLSHNKEIDVASFMRLPGCKRSIDKEYLDCLAVGKSLDKHLCDPFGLQDEFLEVLIKIMGLVDPVVLLVPHPFALQQPDGFEVSQLFSQRRYVNIDEPADLADVILSPGIHEEQGEQ